MLKIANLTLVSLALMIPLGGCLGDDRPSTPDSTPVSSAIQYSSPDIFRGVIFGVGPVASVLPELHQKADATRLNNPGYRQRVAEDLDKAAAEFEALSKPNAAAQVRSAAARLRATPTPGDSQVIAELNRTGVSLPAPQQIDLILAELQKSDSTFVDRFAVAVRSGDQLRIRSALHESARVMTNLIGTHLEQQPAAPAASTGLGFQEEVAGEGLDLATSGAGGSDISVGIHFQLTFEINTNLAIQDNVAIANNAFIWQSSFLFSSVLTDAPDSSDPLVEDTAIDFIAQRLHA